MKSPIIPCEKNANREKMIEEFAEVLKTQAHKREGHGLKEDELYQSGFLESAIQRIRGQISAKMYEKRNFVKLVLNHMQDVKAITDWQPAGGSNRHDYSVTLLDGKICANEEEGKMLWRYWTTACQACALKSKCTTGKERRLSRWEHEAVLEAVQARLDRNPVKMRGRRQTVEHPFGTIKSWMGATHFKNVGTEMALHVLAYNMKRVISSGRWRLDGGDPGIGSPHARLQGVREVIVEHLTSSAGGTYQASAKLQDDVAGWTLLVAPVRRPARSSKCISALRKIIHGSRALRRKFPFRVLPQNQYR